MPLYNAKQADLLYQCIARTMIAGAPTEAQADEARVVFTGAEGWRCVSRLLAELSPSLLRRGDMAAISSAAKWHVADFYYELQKPPERLEEVREIIPYATNVK